MTTWEDHGETLIPLGTVPCGTIGARNGELQGQYKLVEQTYAEDVLNLVLARGYLAKLLENKSVVRYIKQRRAEVLEQFEVIVQTVSIDQ